MKRSWYPQWGIVVAHARAHTRTYTRTHAHTLEGESCLVMLGDWQFWSLNWGRHTTEIVSCASRLCCILNRPHSLSPESCHKAIQWMKGERNKPGLLSIRFIFKYIFHLEYIAWSSTPHPAQGRLFPVAPHGPMIHTSTLWPPALQAIS